MFQLQKGIIFIYPNFYSKNLFLLLGKVQKKKELNNVHFGQTPENNWLGVVGFKKKKIVLPIHPRNEHQKIFATPTHPRNEHCSIFGTVPWKGSLWVWGCGCPTWINLYCKFAFILSCYIWPWRVPNICNILFQKLWAVLYHEFGWYHPTCLIVPNGSLDNLIPLSELTPASRDFVLVLREYRNLPSCACQLLGKWTNRSQYQFSNINFKNEVIKCQRSLPVRTWRSRSFYATAKITQLSFSFAFQGNLYLIIIKV